MKNFSRKFKISHKLLASSFIFVLPIAVLLYYVISGFNTSIEFSQKEIKGVELIKPLSGIMRAVSRQGQACRISKLSKEKEILNLENQNKEIESLFAKVENVFSTINSNSSLSIESLKDRDNYAIAPKTIEIKWKELISGINTLNVDECNSAFFQINESLFSLIRYIGDESNLILDPDLDSYYMMDISVLSIPKVNIFLDKIIAESCKLSSSTITAAKNEKLDFYTFLINSEYLPRISNGLDIAVREDSKFYGKGIEGNNSIISDFSGFNTVLAEYLKLVYSFSSDKSNRDNTSLTINNQVTLTLESSARFWDKSLDVLNLMLTQRIANLEKRKYTDLLVCIITLLIAALFVWFISRGISKPLGIVTDIAGKIAIGNLNYALINLETVTGKKISAEIGNDDSKDETARLFTAISMMTRNLDLLLLQVRKSGIQVTGSSTHISSSAKQLEAMVAEQAAATNEVNATSKEISQTSADLANTMNNITKSANDAAELAEIGMKSLGEMNDNMQNLKDATGEISLKLSLINEKTTNISQVITTITKVANQTNLLSLNAAIEAEKAGELGTGFSVVAREIRRLADQTSVAALEIEEMIIEMQKAVDEGVITAENNTIKAIAGSEKISVISNDLGRVLGHTHTLVGQFGSVNESMQVQSEGAIQINEAMGQLSSGAVQTRECLADLNNTAALLNDAVNSLQREIEKFNIRD